ncbi:MAG: AIPR family protein [Leptolyngbyaceae cyanobacterium]
MAPINIEAQKVQIETILEQRYFSIIPQLDRNWTSEQHRKNRLSRSLAAFAVQKLADVTPAQAANSVVNGENDNGIDAIFFDRIQNCLWLIQSKIGNAPNMSENKKLCDGVEDLINSRFDKFNENFVRVQTDVEAALATNELKIIGCNVHLGAELGTHAISDLNQLKNDLNQFSQRFDWKDLALSTVHQWLTVENSIIPPSVNLKIKNWYGLTNPRKAFYGLVDAQQLACLYRQHGKVLFEKNIRYYLGEEDVNSAILGTAQEHPEELFYLNNGLTAVCSKVDPLPGANNDEGDFTIEGFSIVNGAQTVGSITTLLNSQGSISETAQLLITLIEIGAESDELGKKITRARNTQNTIRDLYFAALDSNQERLRQELAISGVTYQYRPSETSNNQELVTIEQVILALACLQGNTSIVVTAKKEIGQIYPQFKSEIFSSNLQGLKLYRYVQIFKYLDQLFLNSEQSETQTRRKTFYRHGRFFVFHILARRHQHLLNKVELQLSDADKTALSRVALELAELIYTVAESVCDSSKGYLAIFRNLTDSEMLARSVMQELEQRNNPQNAVT